MNRKYEFKNFIYGILAGLSIALGGAAYITCIYYGSPILGSVFFSCGLLLVCAFSFKLYTGQIGKVFENNKKFILDLLIMYLGNFVGAMIIGIIFYLSVPNDSFKEVVETVSKSKLLLINNNGTAWYKMLAQSFLCGILVYFAVEIFKTAEHGFIKGIGLILCVAVFVVCGFQHCIANMFYLSASLFLFTYPLESILGILLSTLGNSLGAIFIWTLFYLFRKQEKIRDVC